MVLVKENLVNYLMSVYDSEITHTHLDYFGRLLEKAGIQNLNVDVFDLLNQKVELKTAEKLGISSWSDGQQIIIEFAVKHTEDDLENASDEDYNAKYTPTFNHYMRDGWKMMFQEMSEAVSSLLNRPLDSTISKQTESKEKAHKSKGR